MTQNFKHVGWSHCQTNVSNPFAVSIAFAKENNNLWEQNLAQRLGKGPKPPFKPLKTVEKVSIGLCLASFGLWNDCSDNLKFTLSNAQIVAFTGVFTFFLPIGSGRLLLCWPLLSQRYPKNRFAFGILEVANGFFLGNVFGQGASQSILTTQSSQ